MKVSAFFAMAALLLFWPFGRSTTKTFNLMPGAAVPAASGTVKVSNSKNNTGNLNVDIKVKDLALPGSLHPPANDYIVWIEPHGEQPLKQGAIGIDGKLQGELKTETTAKNFKVLITAEPNETATSPSNKTVLQGHVTD